jgi:hypothetical protein
MTGPGTEPTAPLAGLLTAAATAWLAAACAAAGDPAAVLRAFPAVGRRLGRGPLPPPESGPAPAPLPPPAARTPPAPREPSTADADADAGAGAVSPAPVDVHRWTVDDAGRVRLLLAAAAALDPTELAGLLDRLYVHGDAAERRGVLRALDLLPLADEGAVLVRDALRTNDLRLVAAALAGGYAARVLSAAEFDQAVLKCLFVGVPLAGVTALPARVSPRLARMVADFARERVAAGRDVPADVWLVLDRQPDAIGAAGLLDELESAVPARRAAAVRFLAGRTRAGRPLGGRPVASGSRPAAEEG